MYNYDTGTEEDTLFSALRTGGHSSFILTERWQAFCPSQRETGNEVEKGIWESLADDGRAPFS
jgi:hypothetical protein